MHTNGTETLQSYDLFLHNCNNFTSDFAMFLVGKGIPDHVTSLPETVLNTPFGQMLKPQLDSAIRGVTQAPVQPSAIPPSASSTARNSTTSSKPSSNGTAKRPVPAQGIVHNITRLSELDSLLASASKSCSVIFFTSATCPPCKICYPVYDSLAAEFPGKATLIKVDLSASFDIGPRYQVRATPTFMTFLHGEKLDTWSGADPAKLQGNVRLLVQMAHPPHPHTQVRLPKLGRSHDRPVLYAKVPPLDKVLAKLGQSADDPAVLGLKAFVQAAEAEPAAPLPDLPSLSAFFRHSIQTQPPSVLFPLVDLLRSALVNPRFSGYFAEEHPQSSSLIHALLAHVTGLDNACPYNLRLVTLQAACNLFSSPLFRSKLLSDPTYSEPLISLVTSSLLDEEHAPLRVSAASLVVNVAAANHKRRLAGEEDLLAEEKQVALVASLVEAIDREKSEDAVRGLVVALGLLAYACPVDGEVKDVLDAMEAGKAIRRKEVRERDQELLREVIQVLEKLN